LFLINATGGEPTQLTHGAWTEMIPRIWSADGKTIYARGRKTAGLDPYNIWAVSVADGSAQLLSDFRSRSKQPYDLSSDGKQFYFLLWETAGDLWVAELSSGK